MEYLVLSNESKIQIEAGSSLSDMLVISESKAAMVNVWELLTVENLKAVQIRTKEDAVLAEYSNLVLHSETSSVLDNGTVHTCFHLREKTEVELLREEVEALKAGQEVQDGAIVELAEIIGGE